MGGVCIVTEMMRRRRALLMTRQTPEWTELSPSWTYSKVINQYGTESSGANGAITNLFQVRNATVKRTGPARDASNTILYMFLHEYNGSAWLKRTELPNPGDTVRVSANCTRWRIAYNYPQASGKRMDRTVVQSYFGAAYKEEN